MHNKLIIITIYGSCAACSSELQKLSRDLFCSFLTNKNIKFCSLIKERIKNKIRIRSFINCINVDLDMKTMLAL